MNYEGVWDLTGEEDLSSWNHQEQTWYKTKRGWFLVTIEGINKWYSTHRYPDNASPEWNRWNGTFPEDLIAELSQEEFNEEDITKAIEFIES
jgi:hypothetical protein